MVKYIYMGYKSIYAVHCTKSKIIYYNLDFRGDIPLIVFR